MKHNKQVTNWYKSILEMLINEEKVQLLKLSIFQVVITILDLLALGLVAYAITVDEVGDENKNNFTEKILTSLNNIIPFEISTKIKIISLAIILMFTKTFLSLILTKSILFKLSKISNRISKDLIEKITLNTVDEIFKHKSQDLLYATTRGVEFISMQLVASFIFISNDAILLLLILSTLSSFDPSTTITLGAYLVSSTYLIYLSLSKNAHNTGEKIASLSTKSNNSFMELISSYREILILNRRDYFVNKILKIRELAIKHTAKLNLIPYISKYLIEVNMIVVILIIALSQFIFHPGKNHWENISIFFLAGTRIGPALLRIQQNLIQLKGFAGLASPTIELFNTVKNTAECFRNTEKTNISKFIANIEIKNLSYSANSSSILSGIDMQVREGETCAIVGESGSGKSTLIDCMLGLRSKYDGEIRISGVSPIDARNNWQGEIALVSQKSAILDSTILDNIIFGRTERSLPRKLIEEVLEYSLLSDFIRNLPKGIDTEIGQTGVKISGGEAQRISIARALISKPKLIVLDEATSALDGYTEFQVIEKLKSLSWRPTLIMVAHRLSSIRNFDQIVLIDKGQISGSGSFNDIRKRFDIFDIQAKSMGL